MSRTQELEHTVFRLQHRLSELQRGADPPMSVSSTERRRTSPDQSSRSSPFSESSSSEVSPTFGTFITSQSSPSSEHSFRSSRAEKLCQHDKEPPLAMIQTLYVQIFRTFVGVTDNSFSSLQCFLPHATQFGFFLDPRRFRDGALLPLPFGDESRPSPALLSVVYLWGAHLSHLPSLLSYEPIFLKHAQRYISTEVSHPKHLLHTLQAQVLLSTYLLRSKRFLEAEFHANGAATISLGYQLHKIRSARPSTPPLLGVPALAEVYPLPPADAIEEGERIRAFWAVTCLQSNLNISNDAASASFCILESSAAVIDTPWPLEIADYEAGSLPPDYETHDSIRFFLTDDVFPSNPICMLHAKASVMLYRATRLGAGWSPSTSYTSHPHRASYLPWPQIYNPKSWPPT